MVRQYTKIKINNLTVEKYLNNYTVDIEEVMSSSGFTAVSGKKHEIYLGDKRNITVSFEGMSTNEINSLFSEIKSVRSKIPITYVDPQLGEITKYFTCNKLPAATYFVSDDGIQFWKLPDITFEEVTNFASSGSGG